jgi:hypothetical protein
MKLLRIIIVGFDITSITGHTFCICQVLEKKLEYNDTVNQLFIDFRKAYASVGREVLYNILIEFGVPMKVVRLIKICLRETHIKICVGKHVINNFPIQNTETLIDGSREVGLEVNAEKTKYICDCISTRMQSRVRT